MIAAAPYAQWKNCLHLANAEIELIATLDVGPRLIRFGFLNGPNEFAEYPEQVALQNDGLYHSYGGHRLWAAPEVSGWTNHTDNNPVAWREENNSIILMAPVEQGTKLQKQFRIHLDADRNHISILHTITNRSNVPVTLSPWAITVMASGGRAIIPQEPFISHSERILPVRPITLWGYTKMQDTRWTWGDRFIQLRQDQRITMPQKFGALVTQRWAAYINNNRCFIKRFSFYPNGNYPDFGCNAEFFTNQRMLEMESLGPLVTLKSGEAAIHEEDWFLFKGIIIDDTEEGIEQALRPLLQKASP